MGNEPVKNFLQSQRNQDLLNDYENNMQNIYDIFVNSYMQNVKETAQLTDLFYELEVDPLSYLEIIPKGYLAGNTKVERVVIPEGIKNISDFAFADMRLKEVIIPSSVEQIGIYAFVNDGNLKEVVIPEGVKQIEGQAFANCVNLEKLFLPHSLLAFNITAFTNCEKLKEIAYNGTMKEWGNIIVMGQWYNKMEFVIKCLDGEIKYEN